MMCVFVRVRRFWIMISVYFNMHGEKCDTSFESFLWQYSYDVQDNLLDILNILHHTYSINIYPRYIKLLFLFNWILNVYIYIYIYFFFIQCFTFCFFIINCTFFRVKIVSIHLLVYNIYKEYISHFNNYLDINPIEHVNHMNKNEIELNISGNSAICTRPLVITVV